MLPRPGSGRRWRASSPYPTPMCSHRRMPPNAKVQLRAVSAQQRRGKTPPRAAPAYPCIPDSCNASLGGARADARVPTRARSDAASSGRVQVRQRSRPLRARLPHAAGRYARSAGSYPQSRRRRCDRARCARLPKPRRALPRSGRRRNRGTRVLTRTPGVSPARHAPHQRPGSPRYRWSPSSAHATANASAAATNHALGR